MLLHPQHQEEEQQPGLEHEVEQFEQQQDKRLRKQQQQQWKQSKGEHHLP